MSDEHAGEDQYRLEEPPIRKKPPLLGEVKIAEVPEEANEMIARDLLHMAMMCVSKFGSFHLALSGGHTPFPLYRQLMIDPHYRSLPWRNTHLWIVDERRAPFDDDLNNFKHINEIIVEHADIPEENVHPVPVDKGDEAAAIYENELRETLGRRGPDNARLDFVMLGMGDNGHTASLFPHTSVLHEREHWVGDCEGPSVTPPNRVTMTYPLINNARQIAFFVLGEGKAEMIHRVATGKDSYEEIPVKAIAPADGMLTWYLDIASAGGAG
ncbi:MAG: 6-phosphogluconolactonase [Phycisphaerales bacterium]|nr:6-phosphogluconolactonase [Phycisphaerales bacterium]